jgi:phosphoserine/homoserine phosphotransferase
VQEIVCLDLEGVLAPEIWIAVAQKTGIPELQRTTRDEPDYDCLMRYRLDILDREGIRLSQIQEVIASLDLLDGARDFLDTLRAQTQVVILSDTFAEFAKPIMQKLAWPTLFCHSLKVQDDRIVGYELRQHNQKQHAVEAFRALNFKVIAAGDSYNDTTMLAAAHQGILFRAPDSVVREFPQFPAVVEYGALMEKITQAASVAP